MSEPLPDSPQPGLHNDQQLVSAPSPSGAVSALLLSSLLEYHPVSDSETSEDCEFENAKTGSDTESDEMTLTKAQKETAAADKKTQVDCELRQVTKSSTGAAAQQATSARNLKDSLDRTPPLLAQLESLTISVINTKNGDARLTAMDEWTEYRDDAEEAVENGLKMYHDMPGALAASVDPAAQEAAVIKSASKEKVTQIIDDIRCFDTALNEMISGDRQLTKIQYITMNAQIMKIKQRIDPGLDQLNQQLVRADPVNGGTAHTKLSAHLKAVLEPFTTVRTKFISNVPDESFTAAAASLNDSSAGPHTITPNSSYVMGGAIPRVSNQLTNYKYKERDPPTFYGDKSKYAITSKISVCCLLDGGSTCSIITHWLAEMLGLKPKWFWQVVELCGRAPEKIRVAIYAVRITMGDSTFTMRLVGMEKISSNPGKYSLDFAYKVFPQYKRPALDKPEGEVEMLIGADQVSFLPGGGFGRDLYENLRVFTIPVAPYKVLMGSHPDISFLNPELTEEAINMRTAVFINTEHLTLSGPVCLNSVNVPADFPDAETLDYDMPHKCNRCVTTKKEFFVWKDIINDLWESFTSWWSRWLTSMFPSMSPVRKWETSHRNVAVGDLVQVMYGSKLIKPAYRMGLVSDVMYDNSDPPLVRTEKVQVRPQSKADRTTPYVSKVLEELVVPVQRLVVLSAIEDRDKIPLADSNKHACSHQVVSGFPSNVWEEDDDNHSSPASAGPPHTSSSHSNPSDIPEPGPNIAELPRMASNYSKFATGSPCWQCNHRQGLRLTWVTSPLPPTEGQGSPTQ